MDTDAVSKGYSKDEGQGDLSVEVKVKVRLRTTLCL